MRMKEESKGLYKVRIEGIIVVEARRGLMQWKLE